METRTILPFVREAIATANGPVVPSRLYARAVERGLMQYAPDVPAGRHEFQRFRSLMIAECDARGVEVSRAQLTRETWGLIDAARPILENFYNKFGVGMTLRKAHYELVNGAEATGVEYANTLNDYRRLGRALVAARLHGLIPWDWMQDATRGVYDVQMYGSLGEYALYAPAWYRCNVWRDQPVYVECVTEKDGLIPVFQSVLDRYGVTVFSGHGFSSADAINKAVKRFREHADKDCYLLAFTDFDPSGETMIDDLHKRFDDPRYVAPDATEACRAAVRKISLTLDDLREYDIPPNKIGDDDGEKVNPHKAAFVRKYGDIEPRELDALDDDLLIEKITATVEGLMDMDALARTEKRTERERAKLARVLKQNFGS